MSRAKPFPAHGPELRALLAACHAHPDDDTARLVLADWLQERDDPRGELVRVQVRLHALPATAHDEYDKLFKYHQRWMKKHQRTWDAETGNFIWHFGPHNRGLPLVGHYSDSDHFWIDPRKVSEWLVPEFEDIHDPFARLHEPPFAGSPMPVGIILDTGMGVPEDVLELLTDVENLRGLAMPDGEINPTLFPQLARLTGLHHLELGETPLSDAQVKQLAPLKELRALRAEYSDITNTGARALRKFEHLRELALSCSRVDSPGVRAIAENTGIEVLDLTGVEDDDLDALRGLSRVRDLRLPACQITGTGIENFPLLTELRLRHAQVTDAGMACLAGLPRLQFLDICNTEITGETLKHLSGAKWLEYLYAANTAIRDEHLPALHGLKHLHTISLVETQVTKKGAARLRAALPKAEVIV
jgi:uncharacterized protein (TIGR02996 family)